MSCLIRAVQCAPVGSDKFHMVSQINRRLTQWAEPLFQKGFSTPAWNGHGDCRSELSQCDTERLRYNVTAVFSTSSLPIPPLQRVAAVAPGGSGSDFVQQMDRELVVIVLRNASEEVPDSEAGVEFAYAKQRYLLVLSTELSVLKGGAPVRRLSIQLHPNITSTQPIEPDAFQGFASVPGATTNSYNPTPEAGIPPTFRGDRSCPLSWQGSKIGSSVGDSQLRLPGGSVQLLTYTLAEDWVGGRPEVEGQAGHRHRHEVGRRPPTKVDS